MARRPTTPKFPIPDAPDPAETAVAVEAAKMDKEFDEFLSDLLKKRAYHARLREPAELARVREGLLPEVCARIDPRIVSCICSNDPLLNHDLPVPKNPLYSREDQVTLRMRSIVQMIYPSAHREFIRQKVKGCMRTIEHMVGRIAIPV